MDSLSGALRPTIWTSVAPRKTSTAAKAMKGSVASPSQIAWAVCSSVALRGSALRLSARTARTRAWRIEFGLRLAQLGDVAAHHDVARHRSTGVSHGRQAEREMAGCAVRARVVDLLQPGLRSEGRLFQGGAGGGSDQLSRHRRGGSADNLLEREPVRRQEGRIGVCDDALGVGDDDTVDHLLHHRRQALALGDIAPGREEPVVEHGDLDVGRPTHDVAVGTRDRVLHSVLCPRLPDSTTVRQASENGAPRRSGTQSGSSAPISVSGARPRNAPAARFAKSTRKSTIMPCSSHTEEQITKGSSIASSDPRRSASDSRAASSARRFALMSRRKTATPVWVGQASTSTHWSCGAKCAWYSTATPADVRTAAAWKRVPTGSGNTSEGRRPITSVKLAPTSASTARLAYVMSLLVIEGHETQRYPLVRLAGRVAGALEFGRQRLTLRPPGRRDDGLNRCRGRREGRVGLVDSPPPTDSPGGG